MNFSQAQNWVRNHSRFIVHDVLTIERIQPAPPERVCTPTLAGTNDGVSTMKLLRKEGLLGPGGYWSKLLPETVTYERKIVEKSNKLYHLVESRFKKAGRAIVKIETVQNHRVWQSYLEAKATYPDRKEVYRFHGTPFMNVDGICKSGFLVSKDVSGGGTKIWSAPEDNPAYSVGYSQKGVAPDGTLYMFLAKVLADSTTTNQWTVTAGAFMYPEFLIVFK